MKAELITLPYSDLTVVNAARVSFDKESGYGMKRIEDPTAPSGFRWKPFLEEADIRLINYLAKHNHWTPFSHARETFSLRYALPFHKMSYTDIAGMVWLGEDTVRHSIWGWANLIRKGYLIGFDDADITGILCEKFPESMKAMGITDDKGIPSQVLHQHKLFTLSQNHPDLIDITMRETVPIFVARQRFKHMVGFTYNEVSRRYVDDTPEFFYPQWRGRPDGSIKQGSSGQHPRDADWHSRHHAHCQDSGNLYQAMLADNVAPEQARAELPQSMFTSYYVTAPLSAWARAYKQRIDPHAQVEIQELAKQWGTNIRSVHPDAWDRALAQ